LARLRHVQKIFCARTHALSCFIYHLVKEKVRLIQWCLPDKKTIKKVIGNCQGLQRATSIKLSTKDSFSLVLVKNLFINTIQPTPSGPI
jgi:hypothetical protein